MLEKLNLSTLLLEEDPNHVNELVAAQSNHSSKVEDLTYGRSSLIFNNVNSNLQYKYLAFCLRYFTYFKINNSSSQVETYKTSLRIKEASESENNLNLSNSLAIKYSRSLVIESNSLDSTTITSRKHRR